jgi:hypothetical protein
LGGLRVAERSSWWRLIRGILQVKESGDFVSRRQNYLNGRSLRAEVAMGVRDAPKRTRLFHCNAGKSSLPPQPMRHRTTHNHQPQFHHSRRARDGADGDDDDDDDDRKALEMASLRTTQCAARLMRSPHVAFAAVPRRFQSGVSTSATPPVPTGPVDPSQPDYSITPDKATSYEFLDSSLVGLQANRP